MLRTKILRVNNATYVKVFNLLGQQIIQGKNEVELSKLDNQIIIIKTNKGTFKQIVKN